MKLTRREALKITIRMWTWIAKNVDTRGTSMFNPVLGLKGIWLREHGYEPMDSSCPCCEYDIRTRKSDHARCSSCPIWGRSGHNHACLDIDSPYTQAKWMQGAERIKACRDLVALARKQLKRMDAKKGKR